MTSNHDWPAVLETVGNGLGWQRHRDGYLSNDFPDPGRLETCPIRLTYFAEAGMAKIGWFSDGISGHFKICFRKLDDNSEVVDITEDLYYDPQDPMSKAYAVACCCAQGLQR